eukprot:5618135-Prymnesium_polylepis.1
MPLRQMHRRDRRRTIQRQAAVARSLSRRRFELAAVAMPAAGQQWMVPPLLPGASTARRTRSHQQRRLALFDLGAWALAPRGSGGRACRARVAPAL